MTWFEFLHFVPFSGNQFDFDDAILNALKGLQIVLEIDSSLELDDCKLRIRLALCLDSNISL